MLANIMKKGKYILIIGMIIILVSLSICLIKYRCKTNLTTEVIEISMNSPYPFTIDELKEKGIKKYISGDSRASKLS